jgi:hypothetical protein
MNNHFKSILLNNLYSCKYLYGARSGVVVEARRYKPEVRGFDLMLSLDFFIDIILPVA